MKLRVLFDRIVVDVEKFSQTRGGIYLPQDVSVTLMRGKVVSKGDGAIVGGRVVPLPVEVGDTIIFDHNAIEKVVVDEQEFNTLRITDVMGVLEDEPLVPA